MHLDPHVYKLVWVGGCVCVCLVLCLVMFGVAGVQRIRTTVGILWCFIWSWMRGITVVKSGVQSFWNCWLFEAFFGHICGMCSSSLHHLFIFFFYCSLLHSVYNQDLFNYISCNNNKTIQSFLIYYRDEGGYTSFATTRRSDISLRNHRVKNGLGYFK